MKALLKKLVETPGPPGYETEVRKLVRAAVEPHADEVRVDGLGNLIARKGQAASEGRRVLVLAHMDEPGMIAAHVNDRGLVRFMPLGNLQPEVCAGQRVRFLNGAAGVIGYPSDTSRKPPGIEQLFIDLGANGRDGLPVSTGDVAVFSAPFSEQGEYITAKALDNRAGVSVLIECLRRLGGESATPHELFFAFTTQEQPGVRGAGAAAFDVQPDIILAVDVCDAGDTPGGRGSICLGEGPVIRVRDRSMLSHPAVVGWIESAAGSAIPYQKEVGVSGAGGASMAQGIRAGAPAATLSVACRYRGSPVETVHWTDVEHLAGLLTRVLSQPASV